MKFKEYLEENISMEMSANWDDVKDSLKKAGCFEISEISEIDRGYFITIRK